MTVHKFDQLPGDGNSDVLAPPVDYTTVDPEILRAEKLAKEIEDEVINRKNLRFEEVKRNFQPRHDPLYDDSSMVFEDPYKDLDGKELKARLANVVDRGMTLNRLIVPLPPHLHGEWVPNDKIEILYKQSLGFWIDTEFASSRALHDGAGGGIARISDAIFMVCRKEVRHAVDEIRAELYEANNSKKGPQKEERDFTNTVKAETSVQTPVLNKSTALGVNKDEIKSALMAVTSQES